VDGNEPADEVSNEMIALVDWLKSIHLRPLFLLALGLAGITSLTLEHIYSGIFYPTGGSGITPEALGWIGYITVLSFFWYAFAMYQNKVDSDKQLAKKEEPLKALATLTKSERYILQEAVMENCRRISDTVKTSDAIALVHYGLIETISDNDLAKRSTQTVYVVPLFIWEHLSSEKGMKDLK